MLIDGEKWGESLLAAFHLKRWELVVFVGMQGAQLILEGGSLSFATMSADPAESRWSPPPRLCAVAVAEHPRPHPTAGGGVGVVLVASLKQKYRF